MVQGDGRKEDITKVAMFNTKNKFNQKKEDKI